MSRVSWIHLRSINDLSAWQMMGVPGQLDKSPSDSVLGGFVDVVDADLRPKRRSEKRATEGRCTYADRLLPPCALRRHKLGFVHGERDMERDDKRIPHLTEAIV